MCSCPFIGFFKIIRGILEKDFSLAFYLNYFWGFSKSSIIKPLNLNMMPLNLVIKSTYQLGLWHGRWQERLGPPVKANDALLSSPSGSHTCFFFWNTTSRGGLASRDLFVCSSSKTFADSWHIAKSTKSENFSGLKRVRAYRSSGSRPFRNFSIFLASKLISSNAYLANLVNSS